MSYGSDKLVFAPMTAAIQDLDEAVHKNVNEVHKELATVRDDAKIVAERLLRLEHQESTGMQMLREMLEATREEAARLTQENNRLSAENDRLVKENELLRK